MNLNLNTITERQYAENMLASLGKTQIRSLSDSDLVDRLEIVDTAEAKARIKLAQIVDRGIVGLEEANEHHRWVGRIVVICLAKKKIKQELLIRKTSGPRVVVVKMTEKKKKKKQKPEKIPVISYSGFSFEVRK